jgi:hypothetical protein
MIQKRSLILFPCLLLAGVTSLMAETASERLQESAVVLKEILSAPDQSIPQDLLDDAHCVVVVPGRLCSLRESPSWEPITRESSPGSSGSNGGVVHCRGYGSCGFRGGRSREAAIEPVSNMATTAREATIGIWYKSASIIFVPTKASTSARPTLR